MIKSSIIYPINKIKNNKMELKDDYDDYLYLNYFLPDYEGQNIKNNPKYIKWYTIQKQNIIIFNTNHYKKYLKRNKLYKLFLIEINIRKIITTCKKCSYSFITNFNEYFQVQCPHCKNSFFLLNNNNFLLNDFYNIDMIQLLIEFSPKRFEEKNFKNILIYVFGVILFYFIGPINIFIFSLIVIFGKTCSNEKRKTILVISEILVGLCFKFLLSFSIKIMKYYYKFYLVSLVSFSLVNKIWFNYDLINFIISMISIF